MSGGGQQTTTVQNNKPPKWAERIFEKSTGDALDLYNAGRAAPVNTMSTVVPDSRQTRNALVHQEALGTANLGGQGLSGQGKGIVEGGGLNPAQQRSMAYTDAVGADPFDLSGNQAYQSYRGSVLDDVQHRVNEQAASAGRYGSGAHTGNLVDALSDAGTRMDLDQMGRMDALNQQRFGFGQQGMNNLPGAYDMQRMPLQDLYSVGARNEDLMARTMNDQLRIAQEQQTAPMRGIEWLQAIGSGGGQFGTSTSTTQQPGASPFMRLLGGLSTGIGLLG